MLDGIGIISKYLGTYIPPVVFAPGIINILLYLNCSQKSKVYTNGTNMYKW